MTLGDLPLEELEGAQIVVEEGDYFGAEVTYAGKVIRVAMEGGDKQAEMKLTGTGSEEILKQYTASPGTFFKVHLCPRGCGRQVSGNHYLHAM